MAFHVELAQGLNDLEKIRREWDELFLSSANRAFYNDWRWHAAVARHLIPQNLYYLRVFDAARPVAIFPLSLTVRNKLGLRIQCLEFPSHSHIVLSDALVHKDYARAPVLPAVLEYLYELRDVRWQRLSLHRFTARSNVFKLSQQHRTPLVEHGKSYYVRFDAASSGRAVVSRKQIRNVNRALAKARSQYADVSIETTEQAHLEGFDAFIQIESAGWKGVGGKGSAIALQPELTAFYRELMTAFSATGQAQITLLKIAGIPAAGQFALRVDDALFLLKIGYDEAYEDVAPGSVLFKHTLDRGTSELGEINLVTAPEWADRWHLTSETVYRSDFYNTNLSSRAMRGASALLGLLKGRRAREQRATIVP